MKDFLWSADLFRSESMTLRSHRVSVIMDQFTRQIIGFSDYTGDVNGMVLYRIFNKIIAGFMPPQNSSSDNDASFEYHRGQANLRVLDIDEIETVTAVPVSHPFVERLIGTVRREFHDCILLWDAVDLGRKRVEFQSYNNRSWIHASLGGDTLSEMADKLTRRRVKMGAFRWRSDCCGLVQHTITA